MTRLVRWAVAAFYILLLGSAHAGSIRGDVQQCMYLTNSAVMVLMVKEQNPDMSWEVAKAQLQPLLTEAIGNPDSYIKDQEDADLALRAFEWVWKDRITVEELFDSCTKATPAKA